MLELESDVRRHLAQRTTLLFAGPAGTLPHVVTGDDGRRIQNEAKIVFMNAATQFRAVDFVHRGPRPRPDCAFPQAGLVAPGTTLTYNPFPPGDYDLYLRQKRGTALLSGPTRDHAGRRSGIYGVLAVNGPDTATAGVVLFDDFP